MAGNHVGTRAITLVKILMYRPVRSSAIDPGLSLAIPADS
jgi:hypothetical protein